MIKITYLGTCSGTEPMPGMHHCALTMEIGGAVYWFDAGETCAYTGYLAGIDMTAIRTVVISHPHMDHIGGMANLLSCIRKLNSRYKLPLKNDNTLRVFTPDHTVFDAILTVLCSNTAHKLPYTLIEEEVHDGLLYEDENVRISAIHNAHLNEDGSKGWRSYSFLIEAEGKRIVYSGDVKKSEELDPFVSGGCDLLIHETGHHPVADVCAYAESRGVKQLRFNHHGREIIGGREAAEELTRQYACPALLCYDGMTEEI